MGVADDRRHEFLKMEYQSIQDRFAFIRNDLARTETIYPLAMVAVYAWILTNFSAAPLLWQMGMWLPVPISILAFVRVTGRIQAMRQLEDYTRKLEEEFYGKFKPRGWERSTKGKRPMAPYLAARTALMGVLIAASLALAIFAEPIRVEAAASGIQNKSTG